MDGPEVPTMEVMHVDRQTRQQRERNPDSKPVGCESRSCPDGGQAESSNARTTPAVTAYLTFLGLNSRDPHCNGFNPVNSLVASRSEAVLTLDVHQAKGSAEEHTRIEADR